MTERERGGQRQSERMKVRNGRDRERWWVKVSHSTDEKETEGERGRGRERW